MLCFYYKNILLLCTLHHLFLIRSLFYHQYFLLCFLPILLRLLYHILLSFHQNSLKDCYYLLGYIFLLWYFYFWNILLLYSLHQWFLILNLFHHMHLHLCLLPILLRHLLRILLPFHQNFQHYLKYNLLLWYHNKKNILLLCTLHHLFLLLMLFGHHYFLPCLLPILLLQKQNILLLFH